MARISEIHYSNAYSNSSGVPEFLEISLTPAEHANPADFTASFYAANGNLIGEFTLDTVPAANVIYDPQTDEYIYVLDENFTGIFLTDPDGNTTNNSPAWALTDTSTTPNTVIDFYEVGGGTSNITANNGAAAGAVSENIPLPTNPNDSTYSVQFNQPNPDVVSLEDVSPGDTGVICFAAGTAILTEDGYLNVDRLSVGDTVLTRDNGPQTIRWLGSRLVPGHAKFAPIRFSKDAFNLRADLLVSPNHRVALWAAEANLLMDRSEFLVPAKYLLDHPGVSQSVCGEVQYYHILFDRHELVNANGLWCESFHPGHQALSFLDQWARDEVLTLFPELKDQADLNPLARPEMNRKLVNMILPSVAPL
ncbi:MAG: Hint domain-containing protein [Pseudomonadota bacterium]